MLETELKLNAELPELGKYTVGEDFATILIQEILKRKPCCVLEAGSGVSTILAAYCVEKIGYGSITSLEHLPDYANKTRAMLKQHLLDSVDVKIINASLREYKINEQYYNWYDVDMACIPKKIDFLIVDGPPRTTGRLARYPILPLFYERLSSSAVILLDDSDRMDEQIIVELWLSKYPQFKLRKFSTQKGAVLLYYE